MDIRREKQVVKPLDPRQKKGDAPRFSHAIAPRAPESTSATFVLTRGGPVPHSMPTGTPRS